MTTRLAAVLVVIALLGAERLARADGPSPVIFPEQRIPLAFSHARHLALPGVGCARCHPAARTSRSSVDLLVPTEDACAPCHAIDRPGVRTPAPGATAAGTCTVCHPGASGPTVPRVYIPPPNLKFDHAAHGSVDCRTCHDVAGVGLATRAQLPRMRTCLSCHDDRRAPQACTTCHLAGAGGRVQTRYREGALAPSGAIFGDAHGGDFLTRHAAVARTLERTCTSCHAESFCADCHQGAIKPMEFHAGNYVLTHAVEARRGAPDCSACHRQQSFCVGCHERSGVGARGSDFVSGDPMRRFHPAGFGAEGGHGREARRSIQTCASCHREDFCAECHTAEPGAAMRVNPHPPGWRGSARCEALVKRTRRMCLRCHIGADDARCDR